MVFVTDGKTEMMKWLAGESATAPTHVGYGSGTESANSEDSALGTEIDRKSVTATRSGREVLFEATIASTEEDGESISEIGLLNAASDGDMFNRSVFSTISKNTNFDIQMDIIVRML